MKILIGSAVILLLLSGCAAQETPAPVALQTQDTETTEPSPAQTEETEEPEESEATEPEEEQSEEPTTQAQQTAEASPNPTATATATATSTATATPTPSPTPTPTATPTPSPTPTPTATPTPSPTPTETVVAGYTMADVRMNNTASSCWVAIDGRVFNLTQWIARHPGGAGAITQLCGTDGTATFTARHGGQPSPSATLDSYDIGPLR
jgi:outer membrane biosynthesis protein TonB